MIRHATREDTEQVLAMAKQFVDSTTYRSHLAIKPDRLVEFIAHLVEDDDKVLLVSDREGTLDGMIAGVVFEHQFSGARVGAEFCWWVVPASRGSLGIRLFSALESWLRSQGATVMQMVAPTPEVGKIYDGLGFAAVETLYQRNLT